MKRILIVEDEVHIQKLIEFKLKKVGYDLDIASNGGQALSKLQSQNFDLVLMDIMMPEMDGWTVLESLKKNAIPLPRVIMLSARGPEKDLDRAASLGVTHYIRKPFDPGELAKKVEEVLHE